MVAVPQFSFALWLCVTSTLIPLVEGWGDAGTTKNCSVRWMTQFLNNFGWENETWQQRLFIYDKHYRQGGPLLFYTGNEANIELFVNNTGWMWAHAPELSAALIFAEHRFFGMSIPVQCGGSSVDATLQRCGGFLSSQQAMADYARVITMLSEEYNTTKVVTVGGSYGGMLAAWMRMQYPALVIGALASSAPIGCIDPTYRPQSYWAQVTKDATLAGGNPVPECETVLSKATQQMRELEKSPTTRAQLWKLLGLCGSPPTGGDDAFGPYGPDGAAATLVQSAFDAMAMGSYPFPSAFMSGTLQHPAPPWPFHVACRRAVDVLSTFVNRSSPVALMSALRAAVGVVRNTSQSVACFDATAAVSRSWRTWDFMVCTEAAIHEQPFFAARGPPNDMFWEQPVFNHSVWNAWCRHQFWGLSPRWGPLSWTLGREAVYQSSNIVFVNGMLDPWHTGGILANGTLGRDLIAYLIPDAGHHLDLFYPSAADSDAVCRIRRAQVSFVKKWCSLR